MKEDMLTVSVVMPTFNTAVIYLQEAVESILNQTFQNFEFIIIDDASTNDSIAYLDKLTDPRIRLLRNEKNLGITKSLNLGFRAAKGKYIARMDADDISVPDRFEKQVAFMESHPDVIVCGSKSALYPGKRHGFWKRSIEDMETYRARMLFVNPGPVHPSAFFRRDKLNQYHIEYDERLIYAQNYGLWMTISQYGKICVLSEEFVYHRRHQGQITHVHREEQIQYDKITQRKLLEQLLGRVTEEEVNLHYFYSTGYYSEATITPQACVWLDRIEKANQQKQIYSPRKLKKQIEHIKKQLIWQTFKPEMSKAQKIGLYFQYLSPLSAVSATMEMSLMKIQAKYTELLFQQKSE